MNRLLLGTILLTLAIVMPAPALAGVDISIGISLPPPIVFAAPPEVIVLPDTDDVYVVPDIDVEIFFWNGWWWRLWEGRWYRSHYYNRAWVYYNRVPSFYFDVDPGWRGYYRDHDWHGHRWNYERIPDRQLRKNWKGWHSSRHWERQGTWGVQSYQPRPQQQRLELRQQRQGQYQQRPEVQRHQQQMQERQRQHERQPRVQQPEGQQQRRPQEPRRQLEPQEKHSQSRGQERQKESQRRQSHGKPEQDKKSEKEDKEHKRY